jgi:hypothetical protein
VLENAGHWHVLEDVQVDEELFVDIRAYTLVAVAE